MKMKTTVSYYIIVIRIYAIKKKTNKQTNQKTTIGKHLEKTKPLFSVSAILHALCLAGDLP